MGTVGTDTKRFNTRAACQSGQSRDTWFASQTVKRRNRMIEEADIIICSDADWRHLSEKQSSAKFVLLQSHVTATLAACGPRQHDAECAHQICRLSSLQAIRVVGALITVSNAWGCDHAPTP